MIENLQINLAQSRDENVQLNNKLKVLRRNNNDQVGTGVQNDDEDQRTVIQDEDQRTDIQIEDANHSVEDTAAITTHGNVSGKRAMIITTSMARDINQDTFNETYEHGLATFHRFHGGK